MYHLVFKLKINMKILIWIAITTFIPQLVYGGIKFLLIPEINSANNTNTTESNPYKEALLARPWESMQDYVTVRPGAHMFFWLFYADGTMVDAYSKPLIIWLQGGPGFPASGIGNFAEIGPLTMDMKPRNHTWVKGRNVLFFDYPVSTGFSYVGNRSLLVTTDRQVAADLFQAVKVFFRKHKGFRNSSTYIIGQGYGGKVCPILAFYLQLAIDTKYLKIKLKGVGIGSAYADPAESLLMRPVFLFNMGFIDRPTYFDTNAIAAKVRGCMDKRDYTTALEGILFISQMLRLVLGSMHYNNINQPSPIPSLYKFQKNMNTYVKPMLNVDPRIHWKVRSDIAFLSVKEDYLTPSTNYIENLLNKTKIKVAIYNGNLDADMPLRGATNWVHKLRWNGSEEFQRAKRHKIRGTYNGFYKETKQLSFWWVFGAGHWVPEDNPEAMEHILEYLMSDNVPT